MLRARPRSHDTTVTYEAAIVAKNVPDGSERLVRPILRQTLAARVPAFQPE